jgi:hypothetical protein
MEFKQQFISVCKYLILFCAVHNAAAQSLQRQTLSCTGGSLAFRGGVVQICVGQPSNITAATEGTIRMQQGFLQPLLKFGSIVNKKFTIYPNPATNNVFVNGDFNGGEIAIITTLHGQMLDAKASVLNNKKMVLNIGNLKAGAYALQIRNHTKIMQSTILIKKQ